MPSLSYEPNNSTVRLWSRNYCCKIHHQHRPDHRHCDPPQSQSHSDDYGMGRGITGSYENPIYLCKHISRLTSRPAGLQFRWSGDEWEVKSSEQRVSKDNEASSPFSVAMAWQCLAKCKMHARKLEGRVFFYFLSMMVVFGSGWVRKNKDKKYKIVSSTWENWNLKYQNNFKKTWLKHLSRFAPDHYVHLFSLLVFSFHLSHRFDSARLFRPSDIKIGFCGQGVKWPLDRLFVTTGLNSFTVSINVEDLHCSTYKKNSNIFADEWPLFWAKNGRWKIATLFMLIKWVFPPFRMIESVLT